MEALKTLTIRKHLSRTLFFHNHLRSGALLKIRRSNAGVFL